MSVLTTERAKELLLDIENGDLDRDLYWIRDAIAERQAVLDKEWEDQAEIHRAEARELDARMRNTDLTVEAAKEWSDILERNEYFDGETEIQFSVFQDLCERHGIEVAEV